MVTHNLTKFGDLFRHYREKAGLTQEALAERSKVSISTIGNVEGSVYPTSHKQTLRLLIDALPLEPADRAVLEQAAAERTGRPRSRKGAHRAEDTQPLDLGSRYLPDLPAASAGSQASRLNGQENGAADEPLPVEAA